MIKNESILDKLNVMEAQAESIIQSVTVLRKELEDGGASSGSSQKGEIDNETAKVLARRRVNKLKT